MRKIREKLEFDKTKDKKIKVFCSQCGRETNHVVLKSVDRIASEVIGISEGYEDTIDWSDDYQIIQCQG